MLVNMLVVFEEEVSNGVCLSRVEILVKSDSTLTTRAQKTWRITWY